jgi:hypothetical protein
MSMRMPAPLRSTRFPLARRAAVAAALTLAGLLAGCAAETGASWPKMTDFSRISQKVLTPKEQEQAIQTMSAEQKSEQAKAIEKIEKNK